MPSTDFTKYPAGLGEKIRQGLCAAAREGVWNCENICKLAQLGLLQPLQQLKDAGKITQGCAVLLLRGACESGALEVAQWAFQSFDQTRLARESRCFLAACAGGDLATAQWSKRVVGLGDDMELQGFCAACHNNRLAVAQWLLPRNKMDRHTYLLHTAHVAAKAGALAILEWGVRSLYEEAANAAEAAVTAAEAAVTAAEAAVTAAEAGHDDAVRLLLSFTRQDSSALRKVKPRLFFAACLNCGLGLAKELEVSSGAVKASNCELFAALAASREARSAPVGSFGGAELSRRPQRAADAKNENPLNERGLSSCLEKMAWLAGTFGISRLDVINCRAAELALRRGRLDHVRWLVDRFGLEKSNLGFNKIKMLRHLCDAGDLEAAKFVVDEAGFPLSAGGEDVFKIFRTAVQSGNVELADYLKIRLSLSKVEDEGKLEILRHAALSASPQMAQWFLAAFSPAAGGVTAAKIFDGLCRAGEISKARWLAGRFPLQAQNLLDVHQFSERELFRIGFYAGLPDLQWVLPFCAFAGGGQEQMTLLLGAAAAGRKDSEAWLAQKFGVDRGALGKLLKANTLPVAAPVVERINADYDM